MRYIDEMLREIPIEDLMGDKPAAQSFEESLAIIPDVPTVYKQPAEVGENYTQNIEEQTEQTNGQTASEKISPAEGRKKRTEKRESATVKSRSMGVLAAALAVVLGLGIVTAYFGAVRHSGPLASVFTDSSDVPDSKKTAADHYAETVYNAVNNTVSEYIASGMINYIETGKRMIDLEGVLDDYSGFVLDVAARLHDSLDCPTNSMIVYQIDSQSKKVIFAQWKEKGSSYVGQYPNPKDGIVFGEYDSTPSSDPEDEKSTANYYAKQLYSSVRDYMADRWEYGMPLKSGMYQWDIYEDHIEGMNTDLAGKLGVSAYLPKRSRILFHIDENGNIVLAQWKSMDGTYVGQYPNPADGLIFGTYAIGDTIYSIPVENTCTAHVTRTMKHFWREIEIDEFTTNNVEGIYFDDVYAANAVDENALGAELYGEIIDITLEKEQDDGTKKSVHIRSSDREGADFVLNETYYRSDVVKALIDSFKQKSYYRKRNDDSAATWWTGYSTELEGNWYNRFRSEQLTPVTDLGEEIDVPDMLYAMMDIDGELVEVASTKYANANIQVNGHYYNTKNAAILNIIYAEAIGKYPLYTDISSKTSYYSIGFQYNNGGAEYNLSVMDTELIYSYEEILAADKTEVAALQYWNTGKNCVRYEAALVSKKTGRIMFITSSDEVGADVVIDDKYYKCDKARELFVDIARQAGLSYNISGIVESDTEIDTTRLAKWYKDFLASNPTGLTSAGWNDGDLPDTSVSFVLDNEIISMSIAGYSEADLIVNGRFYKCDDPQEFIDLVRDVVKKGK